ncbi:hypothetical protein [Actinomadura kijaniata]|uniref:hypothetical protein n=1 Tax=Actinomadura kijaniata TaxID=46161 RepID=UPI0008352ADB|nr:hypothetical protein [Actinomadura kijaniata]
MDASLRRTALPGAFLLASLVVGGTAAPAHAQTDWNMVAESIGEAGYYVDSGAKYFKSDQQLDLLRGAQDRSTPVFIAVMPASTRPGDAIAKLKSLMNRKGTYVVLAGDRLQASSTALPQQTVLRAYRSATGTNKGRPDGALVAFVRQLDEKKVGAQVSGRPKAPKPSAGASSAAGPEAGGPLPGSVPDVAKPAAKDDGPGVLPIALAGVAGVAVVGGVAFFVLRKRRRPAAEGPQAAAGAPMGPAAGGPPPGAPRPPQGPQQPPQG